MLQIKNNRLMHLVLALLVVSLIPQALAVPDAPAVSDAKVKLKVGFVYNFLKFIDWPQEKEKQKDSDTEKTITIGIIGPEELFGAFKPMEKKTVKKRRIVIKHFTGFEKPRKSRDKTDTKWDKNIETLKTCEVLIFSAEHTATVESLKEILNALKGSPILTVSEQVDFLENGGIINFLKEGKKTRFEINLISAKSNKLKIDARLLKMAKRVVQKKPANGDEN